MRIPDAARTPYARLLGLCVVAGVLLAGMTFPVAAGVGLVAGDAGDSVTSVSSDIVTGPLPQASIITDNQGRLIASLFDQNRTWTPGDQISPAMKAAMVAVEDRRFYQHQGVDWAGTMRALIANSASGDVVQGASTISQQYVKNYLLYVAAQTDAERLKATEQTPARKLKEARIALQMERSLSKDEILTRYLNVVFWGNNAYGIKAAASTYFNTTPDKLTVPQAALLAGMVRSTSAFDPVAKEGPARERRNLVISQMRDQQMITEAQAAEAMRAPLGVVNPLNFQPNGCIGARDAGFFCKYVVEYLNERGISTEKINRGGYTIRTTLDADVLAKMKASLDAEVPPTQPHVANVMSVVEPGTDRHRVLGMASSRTFGLDAAEQETSYGLPYEPVNLGSGSVFKIFTAATVLEKGLGIDTMIPVPPSGYASPVYRDAAGKPIPVRNAGDYAQYLSITDALAQSPNTAFVKLIERTGVNDVVDMAVRLGMRQLLTQQVPRTGGRNYAEVIKAQQQASFTLGVNPTSVLELANVGATLASGGTWCPPSPIESITDADGQVVPLTETPCEQVVAPGLANTLLHGLSKDDLPGGTAARAAGQVGWKRPMAGKTGTTQNHKSAAFFGVVPEMAGAVITFDNSSSPRPLCDSGGAPFACGRGNIFGGKTPAETWFGAMTPILEGKPVTQLPPADPRYIAGGSDKQVPDVRDRGLREARAILARAGWTDVTTQTVDNAASEGTVVGQDPLGPALPGDRVTLQVSSGEPPEAPPAPGDDDDDDDDDDDGG
ncbi:transglycosylase domain-containing protein [Pseudonocardia sp.]|uniref:transglycosylase domain-containing protein n=1 Tax=Pseudonocardia sp. TaxID=60912 RepID=UPI003D106D01